MAPPAQRSPSTPTLAERRARLLARIHRSYVTTTQKVRLGDVSIDFTRVADPDVVLDQVADEADRRERLSGHRQPDEHLHLPYWAELWDSAMAIGQFLVREGSRFGVRGLGGPMASPPALDAPPRTETTRVPVSRPDAPPRSETSCVPVFGPVRVFRADSAPNLNPEPRALNLPSILDLGCGMGLSGTIAAAQGARVLFADLESPALLFARLNSLPWSPRVRARRLNWRTDRLDETFDLILGADILYERAQWERQEPFFRHHLAPGGQVLLGEPGRQTGDLFIDWIRDRGWRLEVLAERVPTRQTPVRILRLVPR